MSWRHSMYSHERPQPCDVIWIRTQRLLARLQQQVRRLRTWYDEGLVQFYALDAVCVWSVHMACRSVGWLLPIPNHTLRAGRVEQCGLTLPMADSTTTGAWSWKLHTMSATSCMRSALATEEPPNL